MVSRLLSTALTLNKIPLTSHCLELCCVKILTPYQGIKRKCDHVGKVSSYTWDKENCIAEINKLSTSHELKSSEVAKNFTVRNKNGTFQSLLVLTERVCYASCKDHNLQPPRSSPSKWKLFILDNSHYATQKQNYLLIIYSCSKL